MNVLTREFYLRDAVTVAKELLGKTLVRRWKGGQLAVTLTEVEAYLGVDDPACHSARGRRTSRTQVMYGPGGFAYIYLIYGMHHMLNVVTGLPGDPCAALLRAATPVEGKDIMSCNRFGKPWKELARPQVKALCDGPGKLAKALGLTRAQNGWDLTAGELLLCEGQPLDSAIAAGPRIGIDYAGEAAKWPLNFKLVTK